MKTESKIQTDANKNLFNKDRNRTQNKDRNMHYNKDGEGVQEKDKNQDRSSLSLS